MSRKALFFGFRIQIERLFAPLFVLPGGAPGCESYSKTIDLAVPVLSAGFRPKRVGFGCRAREEVGPDATQKRQFRGCVGCVG